jgi:hypothetical protein
MYIRDHEYLQYPGPITIFVSVQVYQKKNECLIGTRKSIKHPSKHDDTTAFEALMHLRYLDRYPDILESTSHGCKDSCSHT